MRPQTGVAHAARSSTLSATRCAAALPGARFRDDGIWEAINHHWLCATEKGPGAKPARLPA